MSYPRWSTSLVVNKQFWSDQSAVDQNETSKRNQLPHDPTTNTGIRSNGLWSHHLNPDTDIRKCTKKSCPLRHKWLHQQNTRMRDKHVNITWVADSLWCQNPASTRGHRPRLIPQTWWQQNQRSTWVLPGEVQLWHSQKLLPKNSTRMEPPTRHHSWGQLHRGVQG